MGIVSRTVLKSYFDEGDIPTAAQFIDLIDTLLEDNSGARIKTAYEGQANTNAVTDSEKTVLGNTSGANTGDQTIPQTGVDFDPVGTDNSDDNATNTSSVAKSLFDAQTILQATSDNTPVAITIAEQRILGRITAGNITALTAAQIRTLLNVADGATANTGNVVKVGTPVDNQIGIWTGDGTIEGNSNLELDGTNLILAGKYVLSGSRNAVLMTEVSGELVDFGTNYDQSNVGDETNPGAMFRIDVRTSLPKELFTIHYQPTGQATGAADVIYRLSTTGDIVTNGSITTKEQSADPADPAEGHNVQWQSDGTGSGDDGDIMMKITAGATTKTITLVDFSAF